MSGIGLWSQTNLLNWALLGATPTRPSAVYIGLSLAAPVYNGFNEATDTGYARQSGVFGPATASGGMGSASNTSPATFGPFAAACVINGIFVTDQLALAGGNNLFFGPLALARSPQPGDSLILATGALVITLN